MRSRLNALYAKYTGKPIEEIEKAMDRDTFLEADEAKAFGIVDKVFETPPRGRRGRLTDAADAPRLDARAAPAALEASEAGSYPVFERIRWRRC